MLNNKYKGGHTDTYLNGVLIYRPGHETYIYDENFNLDFRISYKNFPLTEKLKIESSVSYNLRHLNIITKLNVS